ncbi:MAG: GumC family protein [Fidelibacterota bacterium]
MNIIEIWNTLWNKRKILIINFVILAILSITISLILPVWYKSTVVVLPPKSESSLPGIGVLGDLALGGILTPGNENQNRFLAILNSRRLLTDVIQKYDLMTVYDKELMVETIKELKGNMDVEIGEELQINISVLDKDPERVADMANYIVKRMDDINIELSTKRARENRIFMEERLFFMLDSLSTLENNLKKFMEENGIISFEDQIAVGVSTAGEIKLMLMQQESELNVASKMMDQDNPRVVQLKMELQELKKHYDQFFSEKGMEKLIPNLSNAPELGIELEKYKRQIEYFTKVLTYLGPQVEQYRAEELKEIPSIEILDHAVVPEKKSKPKRSIIVIVSTFLGTALAAFYLLASEKIKRMNTLKS